MDRYESSDAYSDLERTVIRFSEQWTRNARVDADVINQLRESLSPEHLVRLAATVAQANWTNRFNETFGVELP